MPLSVYSTAIRASATPSGHAGRTGGRAGGGRGGRSTASPHPIVASDRTTA